LVIGLALASLAFGQTAEPSAAAPEQTAAALEQNDLTQAMGEAGNSAVDIIRALEQHLANYPATKQRLAIEQTLTKAAIETNDGPRVLLYGERLLANPTNDLQLIDRVIRELVAKEDPASAKKALEYLKRYQAGVAAMRTQAPPQHFTPGQWSEQTDRAAARTFALEAHALGTTGETEAALDRARKSWAAYPTGEGAREEATWLTKLGRDAEAIRALADAFTIEDAGNTEADRAKDRVRMGALYAKAHGSENGLGDLILEAYDRTSGMMKDRTEKLKVTDPNALAAEIFDFTLQPLNGGPPLVLSSLRGKTVVMDFWATWCVPCRAQHPLVEKVKKRFEGSADVVFLAIDADDDPSLAAPFMKEQGWSEPSWFEGGLERKLVISSIPTLLVLDRSGRVSSRITGLLADRFEEMLTRRVTEALAGSPAK
jgi:thiol-disulfide isomerase/thioredoxin